MCRFVAYLGKPIILSQALLEPEFSLICQSRRAMEMVRGDGINGDGYGIAWYQHDIDPFPAVIKSCMPIWSDHNLYSLLPKIKSSCFLGHIRAATEGKADLSNVHPFHYKQYLFMHNGHVEDFLKIKRPLRQLLCDELYYWVSWDKCDNE